MPFEKFPNRGQDHEPNRRKCVLGNYNLVPIAELEFPFGALVSLS